MNFAPLPAVDAAAVPSDGYLLDVRENDEWSVGHAPEAVHIPMSELVARIAELPADRTIHVVCRVGGRSAQVAQYLIAQGVDAVNVDGGMLAWHAAGRPLVSETDAPAGVL
ncbi:rhodanese-like domain-containing protein [Streptomyces sp. ICBB 8177]|uniref:rhodanese-like domain-containing protein n=1 Tax=Streptomyces sp. ICBB 8177 TaxID=563922 RepID=UPI000D680CCA|nr:rhodanese-like domain-containing protein [Streptomyces sp. ICBB 8177]PWI41182.1 sulfurtransferase [Streptomyces sp. ICBB 8177]